ncbi:MAG: hypothetical protein ACFFCV_11410 [Promethearchaeota archaeon]
MNKKFGFFLPIFFFWFFSLITISRIELYFEWIFAWTSIYSNLEVFGNVLHSFFIGCFAWSIVSYYLGTINFKRFRKAIKSISLFYPFWLCFSIFLSSIGLSSFSNVWIIVHILLRIWVGIGLLIAIIMILNFLSSRIFKPIFRNRLIRATMEREPVDSEIRSSFYKYINFLEKHQLEILVFIILFSGTFFIISSALGQGTAFLTAIFLFLVIIIISFLYDIDYFFSKRVYYTEHIKPKSNMSIIHRFDELLNRFKKLIDQGNKFYSDESYESAIENWKEAVQIYYKLSKMIIRKKNFDVNLRTLKENIYNAYKGAFIVHLKNGQEAYSNLDLVKAENEWKSALKYLYSVRQLRKYGKSEISSKEIQLKIKEISLNLKRVDIEIIIKKLDDDLKLAHVRQDEEIAKTIIITDKIILRYSKVKKKAQNYKIYKEFAEKIQNRLVNVRVFQERLQEKLDKSMGITPLENQVKFDLNEFSEFEMASVIKDETIKQIISVIREYEFIAGQVRFKIGLVNNIKYPLTNLRITFDLPKSLKWIMHEPNYERKGDSILIPKLGAKEKRAVSLYFEPLNCMESHINATVSFFDIKDKPHAIPMKPKMISISCPIFFTESDANLARVKSLRRNLTHRDKKVFPIIDIEKTQSIFNSILSVLEQFDIKLISNEFFEENNFGEAWFFGVTKVKKERLVMNVLLDGDRKTLEFEVSGNNEEQITAFLAEIGDRVRQKLIENNIINSEEGFYDMRIAILSCLCPYCYTLLSSESVEKFRNGEIIECENCCVNIKID